MNAEEVCDFLGLPWPLPDGKVLRPDIAAALAGVPAPGTIPEDERSPDGGYMRAFREFLKVAGSPEGRVLTVWDSGPPPGPAVCPVSPADEECSHAACGWFGSGEDLIAHERHEHIPCPDCGAGAGQDLDVYALTHKLGCVRLQPGHTYPGGGR